MTVVIENTTRVVPVIVARIPIQTLNAEELMLLAIPAIVEHVQQPDSIFTVQIVAYNGEMSGRRRKSYSVPVHRLAEDLEQLIKGHPDGYPAGPWPFAADIKSDTTEVRIFLTEV